MFLSKGTNGVHLVDAVDADVTETAHQVLPSGKGQDSGQDVISLEKQA